jgi:TPR repeat protein
MKTLLLIIAVLFSANTFAGLDEASAAYSNGDYKTAFLETKVPAEQGIAVAQFNLAVMYEKGQGTSQDDEKALFWYTKSAEQGNADAQFNLGNLYYEGLGITQDYKAAIHWYRKSAEQGLAVAQNLLAGMYIFGQGTTQDYVLAYMWLKIAASNESTTAQGNIDKLKGMMTPSQIEQAQDLEQECVANDYKAC